MNAHTRALAHLIARALLGRLSGDDQVDAAHDLLDAMKLDNSGGMKHIEDESLVFLFIFHREENMLIL